MRMNEPCSDCAAPAGAPCAVDCPAVDRAPTVLFVVDTGGGAHTGSECYAVWGDANAAARGKTIRRYVLAEDEPNEAPARSYWARTLDNQDASLDALIRIASCVESLTEHFEAEDRAPAAKTYGAAATYEIVPLHDDPNWPVVFSCECRACFSKRAARREVKP
jgi:hypothetical protein